MRIMVCPLYLLEKQMDQHYLRFSCLFAGVLPPDHLYRIWDVLFYEGKIHVNSKKSRINAIHRPYIPIPSGTSPHHALQTSYYDHKFSTSRTRGYNRITRSPTDVGDSARPRGFHRPHVHCQGQRRRPSQAAFQTRGAMEKGPLGSTMILTMLYIYITRDIHCYVAISSVFLDQ